MVVLKHSSSIMSFTSALKSSGSSIASQPSPWVSGTKRAPTIAAQVGDRAMPEQPDVVTTLNESAGDPQCRHEIPRAVPRHAIRYRLTVTSSSVQIA